VCTQKQGRAGWNFPLMLKYFCQVRVCLCILGGSNCHSELHAQKKKKEPKKKEPAWPH